MATRDHSCFAWRCSSQGRSNAQCPCCSEPVVLSWLPVCTTSSDAGRRRRRDRNRGGAIAAVDGSRHDRIGTGAVASRPPGGGRMRSSVEARIPRLYRVSGLLHRKVLQLHEGRSRRCWPAVLRGHAGRLFRGDRCRSSQTISGYTGTSTRWDAYRGDRNAMPASVAPTTTSSPHAAARSPACIAVGLLSAEPP